MTRTQDTTTREQAAGPFVHTLSNGLTVVLEESHLTPAAAVVMLVTVGARDEEEGLTGLAHLYEHIMFEGSAHVEAGEHFAAIDAVGGRNNAYTTTEFTAYDDVVPITALDLVLWLESDRLGTVLEALDQRSLDAQRDIVRNERRQRTDDVPYGDADERSFAAAFPAGHQYHHLTIGSMEDIGRASLDDVRAFFRTHYTPSSVVLSVVGDVDPAQLLPRLEELFGRIPAGTAPATAPQPIPATGSRQDVVADVPAPAVSVLWPTPADGTREADALDLATMILGGMTMHRLERALVHDQEIALGGYLGMERRSGGNTVTSGFVQGTAATDGDALLDAVFEQVRVLSEEGIEEDEIASALAALRVRHAMGIDDLAGRADDLARNVAVYGDPDAFEHHVRRLEEITAEEAAEAARTHLTRETATIVVHTPAPRKEQA